MDIFQEYEVTSGIVNLGGNVQLYGTKTDGSLWRVAVQDPADSEAYIGILSVSDKAVITSGGYERYFEEDGTTYHHIIDPTTGYPAENGLISVTIISADGTLADGLSTSIYIMGLDKAISFWESRRDEFDMVLMTDEREIYVTEGIAQQFASDYEWNTITGNED
jgi:thiamine biosynthesis lipoprotein